MTDKTNSIVCTDEQRDAIDRLLKTQGWELVPLPAELGGEEGEYFLGIKRPAGMSREMQRAFDIVEDDADGNLNV